MASVWSRDLSKLPISRTGLWIHTTSRGWPPADTSIRAVISVNDGSRWPKRKFWRPEIHKVYPCSEQAAQITLVDVESVTRSCWNKPSLRRTVLGTAGFQCWEKVDGLEWSLAHSALQHLCCRRLVPGMYEESGRGRNLTVLYRRGNPHHCPLTLPHRTW